MSDTGIFAPGAEPGAAPDADLTGVPAQSFNPFILLPQPQSFTGRPEVPVNMNFNSIGLSANFASVEMQRLIGFVADSRIEEHERRTIQHMIDAVDSSYFLR